jgi:alkanesulfonate monooxygenase SsuD/methylene tetrahydromethanopterin reductase-like flavin-dependent oxidoreductase (luciferase family)
MAAQLRRSATTHGRAADALKIVVLGHVVVTDSPIAENRPDFVGTLDQIRGDINTARELGADELILNPGSSPTVQSLDGFIELMEQLYQLA